MAEKIRYLDGLRGIAAFVVVLCHFAFAFYPGLVGNSDHELTGFESLIYESPLSILLNGRFAVLIFFILSGYVLTYKFFQDGDQSVLNSSAVRRYFRLLPPIVLSILCTLVVMLVFLNLITALGNLTGINYLESYFDHPLDLAGIFRQALWGSFFDSRVEYNSVLWTMNVEFLGSMLVFSFASLFGRMRNRWVFYLGAGLLFFNSYYLAFILGMLLADMYGGKSREKFAIGNRVLLLSMLGAGIFFGSYSQSIFYGGVLTDLLRGLPLNTDVFYFTVGAFLILLVLLNSPWLKAALSHKYLAYLGAISFSMYLLHFIVFGSFTTVLLLILLNVFHLSYFTSVAVAFLLTILAVLALSCLAYRYVDLAGIRLSKKLYDTCFAGDRGTTYRWPDYAAVKKQFIYHTEKNLTLIILLQVILLLAAAGTIVFVKPALDSYHFEAAEADAAKDYMDYENKTAASYQTLAVYASRDANTSSIGQYKDWVTGYKSLTQDLARNYDQMNASGTLYQSYLDDTESKAVSDNLSYYGDLVRKSVSSYQEYDAAYNSWYWYSTVPDFTGQKPAI